MDLLGRQKIASLTVTDDVMDSSPSTPYFSQPRSSFSRFRVEEEKVEREARVDPIFEYKMLAKCEQVWRMGQFQLQYAIGTFDSQREFSNLCSFLSHCSRILQREREGTSLSNRIVFHTREK